MTEVSPLEVKVSLEENKKSTDLLSFTQNQMKPSSIASHKESDYLLVRESIEEEISLFFFDSGDLLDSIRILHIGIISLLEVLNSNQVFTAQYASAIQQESLQQIYEYLTTCFSSIEQEYLIQYLC